MKEKQIRVSKKDLLAIKEARKLRKAKTKKIIAPGPWTKIEPEFKIKAQLKPSISISSSLGQYVGIYRCMDGWKEKGTYPIVINITAKNMSKSMNQYSFDDVLAACEKSLNNIKDDAGKKIYGEIVLLEVLADHSKNPKRQFISCLGKTSRKRINGFMAVRKGILQVIKDEPNED